VGYWATLSLNIPDFTRYAKSQESQIVGQTFGLPLAMTMYTFIGIACTSASTVVFGHPIWSPITLLGQFHQPLIAFLALISILIATLNVNIGANVVGPSNDFSHVAPRYISFRTGGMITGCIGLAVMPWRLMASHTDYIHWLVSYSGLLGPVAGIMIADYFFIRGTRLDTESLYRREGPYEYYKGVNPKALLALGAGVFAALIGLVLPDLHFLYDYAWFVGFGVAAMVYVILMGPASGAGGTTPLAQRIAVNGLVDPALSNGAGAKARVAAGQFACHSAPERAERVEESPYFAPARVQFQAPIMAAPSETGN